ncbi:MAG: molybdenum cofactor synthesis domain-containing protein [Deferribacterota bacterium]|nr:molybdenum cofactor synthesis domain-containing protein [Deferribacterota bacterium]
MQIKAISISSKKGEKKKNIDKANIKDNYGIIGDAHAGYLHRQVSFLAEKSIQKMRELGLDVKPGDFAENIVLDNIDSSDINVGDNLIVNDVKFTITQKGKICHNRCNIYYKVGDCIMPREGFFTIVKGDGTIKVGDKVEYIKKTKYTASIITLSDKGFKGEREDKTGPLLHEYLSKNFDFSFIRYDMIPDEKKILQDLFEDLIFQQKIDLIITNGSTGVTKRDIAPDVTIETIERRLLGYEEAMRMESFEKTPHGIISRCVCGIKEESLIINLPGSPKAALENITTISGAIMHTLNKIKGDNEDCGSM